MDSFFHGPPASEAFPLYRVYCTPAGKILFMRLLSNWQRNEKARQKPDTQSGSGFNLPSFLLRSCAMLPFPPFPFGSTLKNTEAQAADKHCR